MRANIKTRQLLNKNLIMNNETMRHPLILIFLLVDQNIKHC